MAHIPMTPEDSATGQVAAMYAQARDQMGFVPDAVKVLSVRPEVGAALTGFKATILGEASVLGARRADMLAIVVSGINHCTYCGTAHAGMLASRGDMAQDDAVQLYRDWRAVQGLDAAERGMLEFAEMLTFTPAQIERHHVDDLRALGFGDEEIFDIVVLTAYRNFINRVHDGLGITTDRLVDRFGASVVDQITSS